MRTPTDATARLRGAFVGSTSGTVSIAAHALAGGTVSLDESALALLITACALVGAVVAAMRSRSGIADVMAMLVAGQAIGHTALTMSPGHHHGAHANTAMLAAHLIAIPVGASLIRAAEIALARAASTVQRTIRVVNSGPAPLFTLGPVVSIGVLPTPRRLLVSSGIGTRGPPIR